jgi:Acetyltransferases
MDSIKYLTLDIDGLEIIKPLWEKLREHHVSKSKYFSDNFLKTSFEKRMMSIAERSRTGKVNIDLAVEDGVEKAVGYCISSITSEGEAEVDSIFVLQEYRGNRIGDMLIERALEWIKSKGIEKIKITVAYGNDEVLNFYKKHGFYPRLYTLWNKL